MSLDNTQNAVNESERQYEYIELCRKEVERISKEAGRTLKAFSKCMGCQMNARDSEKADRESWKQMGYEMTEKEE